MVNTPSYSGYQQFLDFEIFTWGEAEVNAWIDAGLVIVEDSSVKRGFRWKMIDDDKRQNRLTLVTSGKCGNPHLTQRPISATLPGVARSPVRAA